MTRAASRQAVDASAKRCITNALTGRPIYPPLQGQHSVRRARWHVSSLSLPSLCQLEKASKSLIHLARRSRAHVLSTLVDATPTCHRRLAGALMGNRRTSTTHGRITKVFRDICVFGANALQRHFWAGKPPFMRISENFQRNFSPLQDQNL